MTKPRQLSPERKAARAQAWRASFLKPVQPDLELSLIVGNAPLPRSEITKAVWAYIRRWGLLKDRRIQCGGNEPGANLLKAVCDGADSVSMLELPGYVFARVSPVAG